MTPAANPSHVTAGPTRNLIIAITVPAVAVAAGMHYSADVRNRVDQIFPGASDALSKITSVDYESVSKQKLSEESEAFSKPKSTLPKDYENLPDLLHRIAQEKRKARPGDAGNEEEQTASGQATGEGIDKEVERKDNGDRLDDKEDDDAEEETPFVHPPRDGSAIMQASCGECHHHPDAAEPRNDFKDKLARVFGSSSTSREEVHPTSAHDPFDASAYKKPEARNSS